MMSGSSSCRLLPVHMPVVTQHAATSLPRVTFAFSTSVAWRLSQAISGCSVPGVLPVQNPQRLGCGFACAVLNPGLPADGIVRASNEYRQRSNPTLWVPVQSCCPRPVLAISCQVG